jgi:hypothetical protein
VLCTLQPRCLPRNSVPDVDLNTSMLQAGRLNYRLLDSEQCDQPICEQAAPTQTIVPTDELLVVHFISFCEQHIAQMTCRFQNVAPCALPVGLKGSSRKIETHRQFGPCKEFLNQEIAFGFGVPGILSAGPSRFRAVWTANAEITSPMANSKVADWSPGFSILKE